MKDRIVISFGRLSPPTLGHGLLIKKVVLEAKKARADYAIYISKTNDANKNPLTIIQKMFWVRKMFPGVNFVPADDKIRTFVEVVKAQDGKYKNLTLVVGSDRVPNMTDLLNKYNGKEFNFDDITVISAGERDPDADDVSGLSASKMRAAAADNDLDTFKRGTGLSDKDAGIMMKQVRVGMKLKESGSMLSFRDYVNS